MPDQLANNRCASQNAGRDLIARTDQDRTYKGGTMSRRTHRKLSLAFVLLLTLSAPYYLAPPNRAQATTQTVVTIQFDDGVADQYTARSILAAHGMHATFYVNSGVIGDSAHMTWAQLHDLYTDANETGGPPTTALTPTQPKTTAA